MTDSLSHSHDSFLSREVLTRTEAREEPHSGVRAVPDKLAAEFADYARGVEIHVRRGIRAVPVMIIHGNDVYTSGVTDDGDEAFHDIDDDFDDEIMAKVSRLQGEEMREDDLLDIIDALLQKDKKRADGRKK